MNRVPDTILIRVYLLFAGFLLFSFAVIGQVVRVQYVEGKKWKELEQKERIFSLPIRADRGNILADDGALLATSLSYYRIGIDLKALRKDSFPNFSDSLQVLCENLALYFGKGEKEARDYQDRILKGMDPANLQKVKYQYIPLIADWIDYEQLQLVNTWPILNRGRKISGLVVDKKQKRFYPYQQLGRMTLGLVNDSAKAIRGLEYSFNRELRGADGLVMAQRLAGNVMMPLDHFGEKLAQDGFDIQTTLNINMMDVVRQAIQTAVEQHQAKYGLAILMETQTGQIKAIANYPEEYNYAVATLMEPGSTFKIASAIALLEDQAITPTDTVDAGNGSIRFYDKVITDHEPHGKIPFAKAIAVSSNVAISKLVNDYYRQDPARFLAHLDKMGLNQTSGIELTGEPNPYMIRPTDPNWSPVNLPSLSFGYGVKLTPMQLITFYNALANGGQLVKPSLVTAIRDKSQIYKSFTPVVRNPQICSEKTLKEIQKMMELVVEEGTAKNIGKTDYKVAGKTGTVRKLINGKYESLYRASFVGYFPADNPRYTCLILIDEPSGGEIYGSQVAAPVFREIADNIYSTDLHLNQEAFPEAGASSRRYPVTRLASLDNLKNIYNELNISAPAQPEAQWVRARRTQGIVKLTAYTPRKEWVPDVTGMSARDAVALLENLGMKVKRYGHGRVRKQSLVPGTTIQRKNPQTILLELQG